MLKNKNYRSWTCPCRYIYVICQRSWACPYVEILMLSDTDCGRDHMSIYWCHLSQIVGVTICRYIDVICHRLWACPYVDISMLSVTDCGRVHPAGGGDDGASAVWGLPEHHHRQDPHTDKPWHGGARGGYRLLLFCPGHFRSLISS